MTNYKDSIQLLGLKKEFTESDLKKAYHKKALLYHPDKNGNKNEDMFKQINSAYEYLKNTPSTQPFSFSNRNYDLHKTVSTIFTQSFFMEYIRYVMNIDVDTLHVIEIILNNTNKLSSYMIETINFKHLQKIEKFLKKYKTECKSLYKIIEDILQKRKQYSNSNKTVYNISVNLNDLFSSNIFVLSHKNEIYYIPLWYHELEYDDFIVKMNTDLPDHIQVDLHNNIHCHLYMNTSKHSFLKKQISELFDEQEQEHDIYKYKFELFEHFFIHIPIEKTKWREICNSSNSSNSPTYTISIHQKGILKLDTTIDEKSYLTLTTTENNTSPHKSNIYIYFHNK